jgi:two-component system response regulator MprA
MTKDVLIVEDDAPVRRMLARSLLAEGFSVHAVGDGGSALAAAERSMPDVVLLDLGLPGLDGMAVCRRLRDKGVSAAILMITARDAVPDRVAGLEAGADDYLVKPFALEELVARIHAIERRGRAGAETLAFGDVWLDPETRAARRGDRALELTAREVALLELLLLNAGAVVTRDAAIDRIWHGAAVPNVVDRYIAHLRRKLGEPPIIRTVRGVGFSLDR